MSQDRYAATRNVPVFHVIGRDGFMARCTGRACWRCKVEQKAAATLIVRRVSDDKGIGAPAWYPAIKVRPL